MSKYPSQERMDLNTAILGAVVAVSRKNVTGGGLEQYFDFEMGGVRYVGSFKVKIKEANFDEI